MDKHNLFVIILGTDPSSQRGGIVFALPGYFAAIKSLGIQYEFIPTHHETAQGGKWLWWIHSFVRLSKFIISRRTSKQVIVYSHSSVGGSLLRHSILLFFANLLGAKTVMQLHSIKFDTYLSQFWKGSLFRIATFSVSGLVVLTPWWHNRLIKARIKKKIYIIPNPLTKAWEKKALTKQDRKLQKEVVTILAMARIEPGKGVDLIIEAMPLMPNNIHLVVAGDGSQLSLLKKQAELLGVDRKVNFVGWVVGENKQRLFDEADFFCLPSSYDSFGMVFMEAMANGLPVVALDWGPISDVVANERTGILINDKEPKQLVAAIERMMDSSLRQRMGEDAKRWVLQQFSAKNIGVSIKAMFDDI